jgi:uncharacterized pyridoxamine 5'-phosphate oxidase family protein
MNKTEILNILNANPVFYLATCEGAQPRVRGMLMYKADERGIIFHTSSLKDLYKQIKANPAAELCFSEPKTGAQVRVSGVLEESNDAALKEEILQSPSREFLRKMKDAQGTDNFDKTYAVFILKNAKAVVWDYESNFKPKTEISL